MPLSVALTHRTTYRYDRLVTLGPQTDPAAPGAALRARRFSLLAEGRTASRISSTGSRTRRATTWPAWCSPSGSRISTSTVDLVADMATINPFDFFLEPEAETLPVHLRPGAGTGTRAVPPDRAGRAALPALLDADAARRTAHRSTMLVALNRRGAEPRRLHRAHGARRQTPRGNAGGRPGLLPRFRLAAGAGCCAISASPRASSPAI